MQPTWYKTFTAQQKNLNANKSFHLYRILNFNLSEYICEINISNETHFWE